MAVSNIDGGAGVIFTTGAPSGSPDSGDALVALDTSKGFIYRWDGSAWNIETKIYNPTNDGNPEIRLGATDLEEFHLQSVFDTGAQTLDYVLFQTDVASSSANKGLYRFNVDGSNILDINDSGLNISGSIVVSGTVDGRDIDADGTKLDGIESGATADQTNSEIETAYNAQVALASQAEAEAGTSTTVKRWTPERVKQAIDALGGGGGGIWTDQGTWASLDGNESVLLGDNVGAPANLLELRHTDIAGNNGIQITRDDTSTISGDFLGGVGFDSTGGNTPDVVTEASAFIAAYAAETHSTTAKGGELRFGTTPIGDPDDTASLERFIIHADGFYSHKVTLTAGASLSAGDLCYMASDGHMELADADAEATTKTFLAICLETLSASSAGQFLIKGKYTTSGLTTGAPYFVSLTAGDWTATVPDLSVDVGRVIGYAFSTTVLYFDPDKSWFTNV